MLNDAGARCISLASLLLEAATDVAPHQCRHWLSACICMIIMMCVRGQCRPMAPITIHMCLYSHVWMNA